MGGATVEASTKMTQEAEPNTSPYYKGAASGYSNQTQNNTNVEVNIDNRGNGEMDEREKQRYGAVVAKHQQKDRQKQDGR